MYTYILKCVVVSMAMMKSTEHVQPCLLFDWMTKEKKNRSTQGFSFFLYFLLWLIVSKTYHIKLFAIGFIQRQSQIL